MYNNGKKKKNFPSIIFHENGPFTIDQTANNCICKLRQVIIEIIYGI